MSSSYASHFGIDNIPYGIASSQTRPDPQCVTRINDDVVFLAEFASRGGSEAIEPSLAQVFKESTLNAFAALSKDVHVRVRAAIQEASKDQKLQGFTEHVNDVQMLLPVQFGDFTDFSASKDHVLNAGEAITGQRSFPPGFQKYPVGYAGRCSSIIISGTAMRRPLGQFIEDYSKPTKRIIFGASRALDYELEVGAIVGRPVKPGTVLEAANADNHIFGLVLVNDWSARDIQGLEMNPLGPFNGKNFATSISPWVVTLEALEKHKVPAPARMAEVASFMDDGEGVNYSIKLQAELIRNGSNTRTCSVGFDTMYWTFRHMLAHHTIGGCGLRTGDLIASGTVSGEKDHEHGCLMEMTWNGKRPTKLSDGTELRYLHDGDEVRLTGIVGDGSAGIGFGECTGLVEAAYDCQTS
ncbi:hypothetical protein EJ04DRAFT_556981 [Polyplosphaeria fusca]|uniref:Fumarylacetoacetase n=1 Tax=Polyplosphaeria fusca TaxID=682080 RepID=A0A9P4QNA3_9PLEO|nr:hypothetical protein EJ04DRAFT_556981 [Polyplosphaeria fusca]